MEKLCSPRGQSKGERADKPKVDGKALEVVHPHAAGIDSGGREHGVAIGPEKGEQPVRRFDCFTADVERMADCRWSTVAYWQRWPCQFLNNSFQRNRRDSHGAHLVAASGRVSGAGQQRHSTEAKGPDRNERSTQPRAERSERRPWHGHGAGDPGRRAGATAIGGMGGPAGEGLQDGDCPKPGRQLADRSWGSCCARKWRGTGSAKTKSPPVTGSYSHT